MIKQKHLEKIQKMVQICMMRSAHTQHECVEEKKVCWEILADKEKAEKMALMGKTANKIVCWFLHIKRMKKQMKRMKKKPSAKKTTHKHTYTEHRALKGFLHFLFFL